MKNIWSKYEMVTEKYMVMSKNITFAFIFKFLGPIFREHSHSGGFRALHWLPPEKMCGEYGFETIPRVAAV